MGCRGLGWMELCVIAALQSLGGHKAPECSTRERHWNDNNIDDISEFNPIYDVQVVVQTPYVPRDARVSNASGNHAHCRLRSQVWLSNRRLPSRILSHSNHPAPLQLPFLSPPHGKDIPTLAKKIPHLMRDWELECTINETSTTQKVPGPVGRKVVCKECNADRGSAEAVSAWFSCSDAFQGPVRPKSAPRRR